MATRSGHFLYLLTLTAPGDRLHFLPGGRPCRCTPEGGVNLDEWNPTAGSRWNHVVTRLRQHAGHVEFFRAAEVQNRAALHHHAILASPNPLTVQQVRRIAMDAGFGHSVDLQALDPGSNAAARYATKSVAGYVSKASNDRPYVPWQAEAVDTETGELFMRAAPATYRAWSSSRGWGITMSQIRATIVRAARHRELLRAVSAGEYDHLLEPDPVLTG